MLSLERAAAATSAQLRNAESAPRELHVVTDTRTLRHGDVFLALRGERFDGHAYVREAIAKGASAVVVDDAQAAPDGAPVLLVADTKRAYMDLARAAREEYSGRVIAITGSAGKTTTKHLLMQMLQAEYGEDRVLGSPANENNEIGVSKLLLQARNERALVVEMGARHQGEIAELVDIALPHIGVLTNIGEAHLEIFGTRERLASTKWGLFSQGAQAVLNGRDLESVARCRTLASPPVWFGVGEPGLPGVWVLDAEHIVLTYGQSPREIRAHVRLPGAHNRSNLAAALAAAIVLGVQAEHLASHVPNLTLPPGRFESMLLNSGARIIYDAYNANLSGMIAALDAFAAEPAQRRFAVLASMAELGADAPAMHERAGAHAARMNVDALLVGGDFAESLRAGAIAGGLSGASIVAYHDNADAVKWIRAHAAAGDAVLLKGSRKYRMEQIVEGLRE
jgi:UDP-N-acetylmuramoyl-tripeptide--D-alanyl-D-alanine ligase